MKRTMFSSLMLTGMLIFSSNAADFGGKFYVEDAVINPGETTVLSIQLDNDIEVSGFQFQMLLPVGIAYQGWNINEERLPVGASAKDMLSMQRFNNCKLTLAGALNCGATASFTKAQGELAKITIVASPNIPRGTYLVELRSIDICDSMGNDYDVPSASFTLTVGDPTAIETLQNENVDAHIYDLQGRRQSEVSTGQTVIVNGRAIYRQ